MINNDVLKRLRYALNLSDFSVMEMIEYGGMEISDLELSSYFRKDDEPEYKNCSDSVLTAFLDGLIIKKRGPRKDDGRVVSVKARSVPENNNVMKKLKIALELKDDDIIRIFNKVDFRISKSEISALFRRPDHKNFRECGDQMLRNFIQGLIKTYRDV